MIVLCFLKTQYRSFVANFTFMKFHVLAISLIFAFSFSYAQFEAEQTDTAWKSIYRGSETKTHRIIHTKLDVRFDFSKAYMYGKEWLTLESYFYPSDSCVLDAKGMDVNEVAMITGASRKKLSFRNDKKNLFIQLDKSYKKGEPFTLYFDYVSKPNELTVKGSDAITDAKGLYFINPTGEIKNKPTQIWTQGETESNSAWMITIDKPNQKSTEEIYMTVPDKYVTLSNGLLMNKKKNTDGTRTDYWKMELPHAPYLFFMGVGEFAIVKDSYKGKEVSYYVEKKYEPFARGIFGNTPAMIAYFSKILGVDFPWPKYSQIVGRDYVSGAMENTTATLHQESAYQNARELSDGNGWEETIAHELFHQWFGDLVTCESWSNLTVNESFANYSEYLWDEYKYGKDKADAHNLSDMQGYIMSGSDKKDLVRFHYADKENMFDAVSYNKGGRILHMLRNYVGDSAFFKSLNLYLTTNKFKSGEAHQLRLAFEETTGKDLNWFWNQWYYGSGHPSLAINYVYDSLGKWASVVVKQTQKSKIFTLPIAVDVYENGSKKRYNVTLSNAIDSFSFATQQKPEWISVDADRILLATRTDSKSKENYQAQWKYGKIYADRKEALDYFAKNVMPELKQGLKDPFYALRVSCIQKLGSSSFKSDEEVIKSIEDIVKNDKDRNVKAAAIGFLAKISEEKYRPVFEAAMKDSSYSVAGAALKGLVELNKDKAYELAKQYANDAKGDLGTEVFKVLSEKGSDADFDLLLGYYNDMGLSKEKFSTSENLSKFMTKMTDINKIKKGIDAMVDFRNQIPGQFKEFVSGSLKRQLDKVAKAKGKEIAEYIEQIWK